jgi:hypothetical protein
LTSLEAGRLELVSPTSPTTVDKRPCLAPRAGEKDLQLETTIAEDVPRALRGDAGRLRQVLLNLIGNAIKFTDRGGVRVEVNRPAAEDDRIRLRFAVIDTGIGIAADAQERLFKEFSQVDLSATRRRAWARPGDVERIVTAMRTDRVTSAPGTAARSGSEVALPPAMPPSGRVRSRRGCAPPRILLAEDNLVNQQAVGLLKQQGHHVEVVPDGRAAVAAARTGTWDVVLMETTCP